MLSPLSTLAKSQTSGLTFTRAPTVAAGDRITSTQHNLLARAFGDRLKWSDNAWRVAMFDFNLWRQVRNPDSSGFLFPPQSEFYELYQLLENSSGWQWPLTGPDEPEGSNLANPMMQYVHGLGDVLSEPDRLDVPLWIDDAPPSTILGWWSLGKLQRGAYDLNTTASNAPAFTAAQSVFTITNPYTSPMGKSWGAYFPLPTQLMQSCGTTEETGLYVPSYEIFFTGLRTDADTSGFHGTLSTNPDGMPVITYAGSCPCGSDSVDAGHVIGIVRTPFHYYVYVAADASCNYDIDVFPLADWIEGPYVGGGKLSYDRGGQLDRALWAFIQDFRGTAAQRTDEFDINQIAFTFEQVNLRQWYLAPAWGLQVGDVINPIYPRAGWTGNQAANSIASWDNASQSYSPEGFSFSGVYAEATGLTGNAIIEILDGTDIIGEIILTESDPAAIKMLDGSHSPQPVIYRLRYATTCTSITLETAFLLTYKPQWYDLALLLRLSATQGGGIFDSGIDGSGTDRSDARTLGTDYLRLGCIVNGIAGYPRTQADWVTDNPVYDAARRSSRDRTRIVSRRQFRSYEVADGKSILRFQREAYGLEDADIFRDIAPPRDAVTELQQGETYVVRGAGTVDYAGSIYTEGDTFTAGSILTFAAHNSAALYVYDGIRHAARRGANTNEWVMFIQTKLYHPSASNLLKPEAYADYYAWCDRCLVYPTNASSQFLRHITYNYGVQLGDPDSYFPQRIPVSVRSSALAPEAPTNVRYADINKNPLAMPSYEFYNSCQVHQSPYQIESCTVEFEGDEEIVVVTLTQRMRSAPTAPVTVAEDAMTWSTTELNNLHAEAWRTDDNALREYSRHQALGNYQALMKVGDAAADSEIAVDYDPFGSCYPHFFFVKLPPLVVEDSNDTIEREDAICLSDQYYQMETILRAICEHYVDGMTTQAITCSTAADALFDYKFENLCNEAFGGRWITAFPATERPDNPEAFGPLPQTLMYADTFNKLSSAVNLLDKSRMELPYTLQELESSYVGSKTVVDMWHSPPSGCSASVSNVIWDGQPAVATTLDTTGSWVDSDGSFTASTTASIRTSATSPMCDGSDHPLDSWRTTVAYRFVPTDPMSSYAIPAEIHSLINAENVGFTVIKTRNQSFATRTYTTVQAETPLCSGLYPFYDATLSPPHGYKFEDEIADPVVTCELLMAGTLDSGAVPLAGTFCHWYDSTTGECNPATSSITTTVDIVSANPKTFVQVPLV